MVDRRWWARQQQEDAADAGATADEAPRLKPTYVEELEQQLAEKDQQLQDVLARYREASREFDETRARLRKEIAKDVERGRRTFLVELLEVVDNLERALDAGRAASPDDPVLKGVDMVSPSSWRSSTASASPASTRCDSRSIRRATKP